MTLKMLTPRTANPALPLVKVLLQIEPEVVCICPLVQTYITPNKGIIIFKMNTAVQETEKSLITILTPVAMTYLKASLNYAVVSYSLQPEVTQSEVALHLFFSRSL